MFGKDEDTKVASAKKNGGKAVARKSVEDLTILVRPANALPHPPPTADTAIDCTLQEIGSNPHGRLDGDIIELDAGEGPFCIKFRLAGGLNWREGDPFWIIKNDCPTAKDVDKDQIWLDPNPKDNTLTIMNMNVGQGCRLKYRMNFADNLHCDPIVDNGGGNDL
jgi:hypothetical protein